MMLAIATAAAVVQAAPHTSTSVASDFDLAATDGRRIAREEASPSPPVRPRNLDTRDFAVDMPEVELALADNGPVLLVGAMGGRHSDIYQGMPKLAHVAVGWTF